MRMRLPVQGLSTQAQSVGDRQNNWHQRRLSASEVRFFNFENWLQAAR